MSWLPNWLLGTDPDEDERRGAEADAKNEALNKKLHDEGLLDDSEYADARRNIERGRIVDASDQVDQAFLEGLDEGAGNIRRTVGGTVNLAIGTPLKLIPWQIWLAGALYLGFRLGLFDGLLKGILKRKAA